MWRMEAVSTENTKNEVKRRALPLLKESHSWTIFVKIGPTFLVLDLQKVMFLCGSGQEEEYVHNNDESFKKEGFCMHNKDEKRMENKLIFFVSDFPRLLLKNDKYGLKYLGRKR